MSGFISALIKQRRDAKKAGPDTSGRLKEIIDIIRKYDYDDGITPEVLVGIIEDLGPTFVKIGQIASQQSEYIPPEYCDALAKLRSEVAPMDLETVYAQVEKYLGKPVDELFASFDAKALGSASIGQVHRATLFDGTVVAVKVRRPGVVDTVARDFALIEKVLDTFVKDTLGGFDIKGFIVELEHTSKTELDFTNEARNLERFRELNAGREGVGCPRCYRDYTCEAILTEDFAMGREVGDVSFLETLGDDERDRIAALVADNFATQVLTDGFYHADPHSGNVLIADVAPAVPVEVGKHGGAARLDRADQLGTHHLDASNVGALTHHFLDACPCLVRQPLHDGKASLGIEVALRGKASDVRPAQPSQATLPSDGHGGTSCASLASHIGKDRREVIERGQEQVITHKMHARVVLCVGVRGTNEIVEEERRHEPLDAVARSIHTHNVHAVHRRGLVLVLGHEAHCLAQVLLMKASDQPTLHYLTIISLDDDGGDARKLLVGDLRTRQSDGAGQTHAEILVELLELESQHAGLDDVGRGRT